MTPVPTALLVVDMQADYLARPGLQPSPDLLVASVSELLAAFRLAGAPIAHVRTLVRPDGSDAMPHWRASGELACIAGTPGARPPEMLVERPGELIAAKQHYRGFADPRLEPWLRQRGVERVVIAGLYLHACVRETALDAYERGFAVVIAEDAVGMADPDHGRLTREWLADRAAAFRSTADILAELPQATALSGDAVDAAITRVAAAQPDWATADPSMRADVLARCADVLERSPDVVRTIVAEVGKPVAAAREEVSRAVGHLRTSARLAREEGRDTVIADGVEVRRVPLGVVAAIMPWNNPIALPCGKIGPALALGNGVVLKPAPEAQGCAELLLTILRSAGLPEGLVEVVPGGATVGAAVAAHPGIDAVTLTGSIAAGRAVADICGRRAVPLQAELGGNNAAVVLADADLTRDVPDLLRNAFAFAGQRCTAVRRFVVLEEGLREFEDAVIRLLDGVRVGDPADEGVLAGPMITPEARTRVEDAVAEAVAAGAQVVARAAIGPDHDPRYLAPVVLRTEDPSSAIVQQETFGPVAVIQPARDVDEAIALANGVEQGLVQFVCTRDPQLAQAVMHRAEAGIVQWGGGSVPVHAEAPFGGWKASGFGPPEHGRWDAEFYTRPQAVYAPSDGPRGSDS
ncbi:MAG: aldehyde dehydrogenase family protein [Actinomycetales bacterium]|nr:aldehyde dehydrogenase family protein [Actinomycetales bacterium]